MKTQAKNKKSSARRTAKDVGSGALFGISGCDNCPFNDAKYCKLLQWIASESGTEANAWVCDEWRAGTMPEKCPLKKHALTFVPNTVVSRDGA